MRRIVANLLLLLSIAAAAPDGRHKRHFSYIKNFILSFFGDDLAPKIQIPILEPELQYGFYRIPGFNDILIKTLKCKTDELTIVNNSGENVEIKPFESYIGTKSIKETDVAFRNVYTLISTGILDQPESDIMQVVFPIINGLHYEAGENFKPFKAHHNNIQSVTINEGEIKQFPTQMNTNGYNNNDDIQRPFETIYLTRPLKKRWPLKSYQGITDEQNIMSTPNLPKLVKQMPHKVLPLETKSYHTPKGENQENVYKVKQYIRLESEHFRNDLSQEVIPLDNVALRSTHLKRPIYIDLATNDDVKLTLDDNNILKSIGTTPARRDSTKEYKYSKTRISKVTSIDKINNNIYNAPKDKTAPKMNHKHSDKLNLVKKNDEISVQSPLDTNNVNVPLTTTVNELNIQISDKNITENKNNGSNVVKTSDNLPKSKTLSQHIYDHDDNNKSHSDSIVQEKDKLHIELSINTLLPKNTTVLPIVDKTSIHEHNLKPSDTKIQIKEDPVKTTYSKTKDIYKYTNVNTFGEEKLRDDSNTSINNNSSLDSQLDNSTKIDVVQANDGDIKVVESNDSRAHIVHTNESNSDKNIIINVNLVKTNDTVDALPNGANLSQLLDGQISYNNSNKLYRTYETENQIKTNVHTNSPLAQEDSSVSSIIVKLPDDNQNMFNLDLDGNEVKTNAFSNTPFSTYNDYTQPMTNSPPVNFTVEQIGENEKISTIESVTITSSTDLPSGLAFHIVETDDPANEERYKELENFSESFTKGRGDIPYQ